MLDSVRWFGKHNLFIFHHVSLLWRRNRDLDLKTHHKGLGCCNVSYFWPVFLCLLCVGVERMSDSQNNYKPHSWSSRPCRIVSKSLLFFGQFNYLKLWNIHDCTQIGSVGVGVTRKHGFYINQRCSRDHACNNNNGCSFFGLHRAFLREQLKLGLCCRKVCVWLKAYFFFLTKKTVLHCVGLCNKPKITSINLIFYPKQHIGASNLIIS